MSPLTIDFGQGNQLENKGKVREIRILKLVATLSVDRLVIWDSLTYIMSHVRSYFTFWTFLHCVEFNKAIKTVKNFPT